MRTKVLIHSPDNGHGSPFLIPGFAKQAGDPENKLASSISQVYKCRADSQYQYEVYTYMFADVGVYVHI